MISWADANGSEEKKPCHVTGGSERQGRVRSRLTRLGSDPSYRNVGGWLMSRWQDYEDRKTREAVFAHAIDRLTPVLHNIHNNGQSWRENRVPLDKIRAVNAVIGDACPLVWEYVQDILVELSKEGWFDYGIEHA